MTARTAALALAGCCALAGCWKPRTTGPTSMLGRVVDTDGTPLAGLSVETAEARDITDADGAFAVHYKEPAQFVFFDHDGLRFQRAYRPEDAGAVVTIQLPARGPTWTACDVHPPCDATLTWALPDALRASARVRCDRLVDGNPPRPVLPANLGPPAEATCRAEPTAAPEAVEVRRWLERTALVAGWEITPPPVPLTVTLDTPDDALPDDCQVRIQGEVAARTPDGGWQASVWGDTQITAICAGIPAAPRAVIVRKPATVSLTWTRDTPTVDLSRHHPWASTFVLARHGGPHDLWVTTLPVEDGGRVVLPPLVPGRYQVGLDAPELEVRDIPFLPDTPPGILFVEAKFAVDAREVREAYGVLELTAPIPRGEVTVAWVTAKEEVRERMGLPATPTQQLVVP